MLLWPLAAARAATLHVWQASPAPGAPFNAWSNAAHDIQSAVDAAQAGDVVLVTNGMYAGGGRAVHGTMTNRVVVEQAIVLCSVNGPDRTFIVGQAADGGGCGTGAVRCLYLTNGAVVAGFTFTNGHTTTGGDWYNEQSGGGVYCADDDGTMSNCLFTANAAATYGGGVFGGSLTGCRFTGNRAALYGGGTCNTLLNNCQLDGNRAQNGGGSAYGILHNCLFDGNEADLFGGGVYQGLLVNCTLVNNRAFDSGGGLYYTEGENCVVASNTAPNGPDCWETTILLFSCSPTFAPALAAQPGNITADPGFADYATSDYRLSFNSPCVNRGTNEAWMVDDVDLDGLPRIRHGRVDMGAYESDYPGRAGLPWLFLLLEP